MSDPTDTDATLRELLAKATAQPWSACKDGACTCGQIWCADYPVATVERGEWGDSFPAIRLTDDDKAEAYLKMRVYGSVHDDTATANAALIVAAVNALPDLLDRLTTAERERGEAQAELAGAEETITQLQAEVEGGDSDIALLEAKLSDAERERVRMVAVLAELLSASSAARTAEAISCGDKLYAAQDREVEAIMTAQHEVPRG